MKLSFNVDNDLKSGIERLAPILEFEIGDGVRVSAERGEQLGVSLSGSDAVIYYEKTSILPRAESSC